MWDKICVIDTENHSASLYVGEQFGSTLVGEYNTIPLSAPFDPEKYQNAILECQKEGMEAVIVDSFSHSWAGEGGILDIQGNIAKRVGNSYTAWRDVTPRYCRLLDCVLQCPMHVILTLRAKTQYVVEENERGKKVPRKVGMESIARDGIEYEVTTFFELAQDHTATTSKDRTHRFDGQYFTITEETGKIIHQWLFTGNSGASSASPAAASPSAPVKPQIAQEAGPFPQKEAAPNPPAEAAPAAPAAPQQESEAEDYPTGLPWESPAAPEAQAPFDRAAAIARIKALVDATEPGEARKALGAKIRAASGCATAQYRTYTDQQLQQALTALEA